jgi:hypothetical protein
MQPRFPKDTRDSRSRMLCDMGFSIVQSGTLVPTLRRHQNIHHSRRRVGTCPSRIYQVRNGKFLRNVRDFYQSTRCHIPEDSCLYSVRLVIPNVTRRCTVCSNSVPDRLLVGYGLRMTLCWQLVLRSYLNIFDTIIMIVPKYLRQVHYVIRSSLTILDAFITIIPILDTFVMIIPNYLGHVHYDHP